jgi:hypothetical protein
MMNNLQCLARRAQGGDAEAALSLQAELEPQMLRIVRRALRSGKQASPLTRRILAEADQAADQGANWPSGERDQLVARRLCDSVIGGLRPDPGIHHRMRETVRI